MLGSSLTILAINGNAAIGLDNFSTEFCQLGDDAGNSWHHYSYCTVCHGDIQNWPAPVLC